MNLGGGRRRSGDCGVGGGFSSSSSTIVNVDSFGTSSLLSAMSLFKPGTLNTTKKRIHTHRLSDTDNYGTSLKFRVCNNAKCRGALSYDERLSLFDSSFSSNTLWCMFLWCNRRYQSETTKKCSRSTGFAWKYKKQQLFRHIP